MGLESRADGGHRNKLVLTSAAQIQREEKTLAKDQNRNLDDSTRRRFHVYVSMLREDCGGCCDATKTWYLHGQKALARISKWQMEEAVWHGSGYSHDICLLLEGQARG